MQTIHYSLDDIGQVVLLPLDNLNLELIQADISFGYEKSTKPATSQDIDNALHNKTNLLDTKIKLSDLSLIIDNLNIPIVSTVCDGQSTSGKAVGFPGLALVIRTEYMEVKSLDIILKSWTENERDTLTELMVQISKAFNLFLVDFALGAIVDSSKKTFLKKYFDYEH